MEKKTVIMIVSIIIIILSIVLGWYGTSSTLTIDTDEKVGDDLIKRDIMLGWYSLYNVMGIGLFLVALMLLNKTFEL